MLRTDRKSFRPIHPLPILTDTDSNRFLGLLTIPIPIPIFIYEYHTDTGTDFAKNTDIPIPIPIIPIIGLTLIETYYSYNNQTCQYSYRISPVLQACWIVHMLTVATFHDVLIVCLT